MTIQRNANAFFFSRNLHSPSLCSIVHNFSINYFYWQSSSETPIQDGVKIQDAGVESHKCITVYDLRVADDRWGSNWPHCCLTYDTNHTHDCELHLYQDNSTSTWGNCQQQDVGKLPWKAAKCRRNRLQLTFLQIGSKSAAESVCLTSGARPGSRSPGSFSTQCKASVMSRVPCLFYGRAKKIGLLTAA